MTPTAGAVHIYVAYFASQWHDRRAATRTGRRVRSKATPRNTIPTPIPSAKNRADEQPSRRRFGLPPTARYRRQKRSRDSFARQRRHVFAQPREPALARLVRRRSPSPPVSPQQRYWRSTAACCKATFRASLLSPAWWWCVAARRPVGMHVYLTCRGRV